METRFIFENNESQSTWRQGSALVSLLASVDKNIFLSFSAEKQQASAELLASETALCERREAAYSNSA